MTKTKSSEELALPAEHPALELAHTIAKSGGRLLVVGGWVRDRVCGGPGGDLDLEVVGLAPEPLEALLGHFGRVHRVGRSFPVFKVSGLDADVSSAAPGQDFAAAARRRDLTLNAMAFDPLTGELLDPLGGRADWKRGVLRACDPERFGDDPVRGLRVAQLAARFALRPDAELLRLCRAQDLADVPSERIFAELRKLLASDRPSVGLALLRDTDLLRFFPELTATVDVPQDPEWHPEGPVWDHTLMVVDEAAGLRTGDPGDDALLLWAALCHDLGKPAVTRVGEDGRVRSHGHDALGQEIAEAWLERLRGPNALVRGVGALVRHHLAPSLFVGQGAKPPAYRRLARKLEAAAVTVELLERVARADHWGRTTDEARARRFPAGDTFLARARDLSVEHRAPRSAVQGRHVLARGVAPGPEVGWILDRCRALQDETGWTDPERLLDAALKRQA